MRDKLGVFILEGEKGIDVQLFEDPETLSNMYANLKVLPEGAEGRATMLSIEHGDGGPVVSTESKMLPVPVIPIEDRPDGLRLGEGPIHLPKEGDDEPEKE